ncbi:MAG: ABC-F family ATP-binding cassette domain-containing protein [Bacteroidota bacterium]
MITASNLFIKYGDRVLFDNVNLVIKANDRIGLVGRNGAGKSTLLKVISGEQQTDQGQITYPSEYSMGYLHQEMALSGGRTVIDETLSAFDEIRAMEDRIEAITVELGERTDYESDAYNKLLIEMSELNDRFALLGGNSMQANAEKVLTGLGFKPSDMQRPTDEFSGGWQMRIELAKMLLRRPDYLLLDEPTNHLDIESIIWLEGFLKTYPGSIVLISHDKQFLDAVTSRTVEIELGKIFEYKAGYSKFVEMRKERRAMQASAYQNQQRVIAQKERTINRFMAKATKTKMAQSMKKQLDKMERISIDSEDTTTMNIRFPKAPRSGDVVLEAQQLSKHYGDLSVLEKVDFKMDRGDRVAFVGQNGQGKTTLAKILIKVLDRTEGDLNIGHNIHIGYYAQNQSESLQPGLTLLQAMEAASPPEMRTKLRGILGAFMFSGEDVEKKVSVLSGGERARLAMACLLLRPINLLVLDEPTNHLDILSKDVLKNALMEYDGTLIVVSHDRDFLKDLTSRTIEFRDQKLHEHLGDVNFFLEKRALDNMREVEMSGKKQATPAAKKRNLSQEERKKRKQLQRTVDYAERKIEKLESSIAEMEKRMGATDFYDSPDADTLIKQYNTAKADLDKVMQEWEEAQIELEAFDE